MVKWSRVEKKSSSGGVESIISKPKQLLTHVHSSKPITCDVPPRSLMHLANYIMQLWVGVEETCAGVKSHSIKEQLFIFVHTHTFSTLY